MSSKRKRTFILSDDQCIQWYTDSSVNPKTDRRIKENGYTFNQIKKHCQSSQNTVSDINVNRSSRQSNQPNQPNLPNQSNQPNQSSQPNQPNQSNNVNLSFMKNSSNLDRLSSSNLDDFLKINYNFYPMVKDPLNDELYNESLMCSNNLIENVNYANAAMFVYGKRPLRFPKPEPLANDEKPQIQKCVIRNCNKFILKDDAIIASPTRSRVVRNAHECSFLPALTRFYNNLNICEAPNNFYTQQVLKDRNINTLSSLMSSYLYLLYGDHVSMFTWSVNLAQDDFELYYTSQVGHMTNISMSSGINGIAGIVGYIRSNGLRFQLAHIVVSIPINGIQQAHAMVLVFYHKNDGMKNNRNKNQNSNGTLCATVLNPYMDHQGDQFVEVAMNVLRKHERGSNFTTEYAKLDHSLQTKFQAANSIADKSHLDIDGYCTVWTAIIMEIMAKRFAATGLSGGLSGLLALDIPDKPANVWRKIAIDYLFSRTIDIYTIGTVMSHTSMYRLLKPVISKYIEKLFRGRVVEAIRASLGGKYMEFLHRATLHSY